MSTVRASGGNQTQDGRLGQHAVGAQRSAEGSFIEPDRNPLASTTASSNPAPVTAATTGTTAGGQRQQAAVDLDRGAVAQVAHPEVAHAVRREQRPDRGLGPLDPGQPVRGDLDAVGHPAEDRQAAAGLSHVGSPQRRDASRTWALVSPASRSGADRAPLVGGADAGPEAGHGVVGVGAGGDDADRRAPARAG